MRSAILAIGLFLLTVPGQALEESARRVGTDELGDWNAGAATCSVAYYNICTGWVWIWSGFTEDDLFGTVFENCCSGGGILNGSFQYFWSNCPIGWGYTGVAEVYAVDASDCPTGAPLASQPHLPASGWQFADWNIWVPSQFAIQYTLSDDMGYFGNPSGIPSDGRGAACGLCYPTTRTTNSYMWGSASSPLCPGSALHEGVCFSEWLAVARMACPMSVEDGHWGSIKAMYR